MLFHGDRAAAATGTEGFWEAPEEPEEETEEQEEPEERRKRSQAYP